MNVSGDDAARLAVRGGFPASGPHHLPLSRKRARGVSKQPAATFLAIAILFLCRAPGALRAETGSLVHCQGAGLAVDVDARWVDNGGYRPVRITFTPVAPVVADRTLTVELVLHPLSTDRERVRVAQTVEIPAGSGPVRITLSAPQFVAYSSFEGNIREDGQPIKSLSFSGGVNFGNWAAAEHLPAVLIAGDKLPDSSSLARLMVRETYLYNQSTSSPTAPDAAVPLPTATARPLAELPDRWIDYTNLDLVCLSLRQLRDLAARRPAAVEAILAWTRSGGNLVVSGLGKSWERVGELESLLKLSATGAAPSDDPVKRGWTRPDKTLYGKPVQGMGDDALDPFALAGPSQNAEPLTPNPSPARGEGSSASASKRRAKSTASSSRTSPSRKPPAEPGFRWREYQMGRLVALAADDAFPGTTPTWAWILNSLSTERFLWYQRHGLSVRQENPDFFKFLIPGVGLAPVNGFRVLITLFVLAIGPFNYLLLRRWRRLHWLLVTIPVGAGAVTLALFAYAVIADGLGTRARVRSITHLDQQAGQAVCWSRLSYYSGIAPSGGLVFSQDVAVIPLDAVPLEPLARPRQVFWQDVQRLPSGWLNSRTPTQLVTIRSRPSRAGLVVKGPVNSSGRLSVENRLGAWIRKLMVRGPDGKPCWAENIKAGAQAAAEPIEEADVRIRLQAEFSEFEPQYPPGLEGRNPTRGSYRSMRYSAWMWGSSLDGTLPAANDTSVMERTINAPLSTQPGSYLALVDRSPEVELGTPAAREEASLHVVIGEVRRVKGEE